MTILAVLAVIVAVVVVVGGLIFLTIMDWQAVAFGVGLLVVVYGGVWGGIQLGLLPP